MYRPLNWVILRSSNGPSGLPSATHCYQSQEAHQLGELLFNRISPSS